MRRQHCSRNRSDVEALEATLAASQAWMSAAMAQVDWQKPVIEKLRHARCGNGQSAMSACSTGSSSPSTISRPTPARMILRPRRRQRQRPRSKGSPIASRGAGSSPNIWRGIAVLRSGPGGDFPVSPDRQRAGEHRQFRSIAEPVRARGKAEFAQGVRAGVPLPRVGPGRPGRCVRRCADAAALTPLR